MPAGARQIFYQARPKIFARNVVKPEQLYSDVVEVDERVLADGVVEKALDLAAARGALEDAKRRGFDALAIVLMHAYRYPEHERLLAGLARDMGFAQVSGCLRAARCSSLRYFMETNLLRTRRCRWRARCSGSFVTT